MRLLVNISPPPTIPPDLRKEPLRPVNSDVPLALTSDCIYSLLRLKHLKHLNFDDGHF